MKVLSSILDTLPSILASSSWRNVEYFRITLWIVKYRLYTQGILSSYGELILSRISRMTNKYAVHGVILSNFVILCILYRSTTGLKCLLGLMALKTACDRVGISAQDIAKRRLPVSPTSLITKVVFELNTF